MAKYDRRILLPYLQNLYCIELSIRQQQLVIEQYRNALIQLEERLAGDVEPREGPPPSAGAAVTFAAISLVWCFACAVFSVMGVNDSKIWIAAGAALVLALIFLGLFLRSFSKYNQNNRQYQEAVKRRIPFEQREKYHRWLEQRIHRIRDRMNAAGEMLEEAISLRRSLYNLNVLPVQFRSMDAAEYLYDYFVSSKADDIDAVIQSYAVSLLYPDVPPEEPKNTARILNQRIRTAEQVTSDLSYRHYYKTYVQRIMEAEANSDMRELYFKLVQADLQSAAFFARLAPKKEEKPAEEQ